MKITIISVGIIKEKYLIDAIKEYIKRLSKYTTLEEITLKDETISNNIDTISILNREKEKILNVLPEKSYIIALDIKGTMLNSEELAEKFIDIFNYHSGHITFVIGGSLGLSSEVVSKCNYRLSFSRMTFPHQLIKLFLLEQIYRVFKINNNETYHK